MLPVPTTQQGHGQIGQMTNPSVSSTLLIRYVQQGTLDIQDCKVTVWCTTKCAPSVQTERHVISVTPHLNGTSFFTATRHFKMWPLSPASF